MNENAVNISCGRIWETSLTVSQWKCDWIKTCKDKAGQTNFYIKKNKKV